MARLRIYARRAVFIALDYYDSIVVNYEKRQVIPLRLSRMFVQPTTFLREWKRLGFTDEDLRRMEYQLLQNPKMGDVIQGTGRLRKMRFSYEHRGKSSSVRVCYVDFEQYEQIYLFAVFAKNEQDNLSSSECALLKKQIERLEKTLQRRFFE